MRRWILVFIFLPTIAFAQEGIWEDSLPLNQAGGISSTDVTFENLNANGDIGSSASQVPEGNAVFMLNENESVDGNNTFTGENEFEGPQNFAGAVVFRATGSAQHSGSVQFQDDISWCSGWDAIGDDATVNFGGNSCWDSDFANNVFSLTGAPLGGIKFIESTIDGAGFDCAGGAATLSCGSVDLITDEDDVTMWMKTIGNDYVLMGHFDADIDNNLANYALTSAVSNTYLPLAGGTITGDVTLNDDIFLFFGTDQDVDIEYDNASDEFRVGNATGDIVVTFSSTMLDCAIAVYRLINAGSAYDVQTDITLTSNAYSVSIDVPASGAAIGTVITGGSAARTFVWTGLTEDVDATIESTITYSSASDAFATTQTGLTVTAQASGTTTAGALVVASWGPS